MILTFIFSKDDIFRSVKQEAALYAERQHDAAGNPVFDELVFDEEYEVLFKKYFFEAQANVDQIVAPYFEGLPEEPAFFETQDFSRERDYILQLNMPGDFLSAVGRAIDIKIKQYLVDFFMWLWLRTKVPADATTYLSSAEALLPEIRTLLNKRKYNGGGRPVRWI